MVNTPVRSASLRTERTYVKVNSVFDAIGYLTPKSIIWSDGRVFDIDQVTDHRPASMITNGHLGDCFTVVIKGEQKHLFFERCNEQASGRFGRWYVETLQKG